LNYKQQLEVIKNLNLKQDHKERTDCPFCHHSNTMLIDTTGNNIGWYCFHASCKAKGKHEGQKTMDYVTKTFSNKKMIQNYQYLVYQKVLSHHSLMKRL